MRRFSLGLGALFLFVGGYMISRRASAETNQDFDLLFEKYGQKHSVPAVWLKAIAMNESSLGRAPSVARGLENPSDVEGSKSSDGKSWGLMQVTLTTGMTLDPTVTPQKLNNAEYSINLAAQYVAKLMRSFTMADPRFLEWVVKSYNQGPGNTAKEKAGKIAGYANEYWARFQRNLNKIKGTL